MPLDLSEGNLSRPTASAPRGAFEYGAAHVDGWQEAVVLWADDEYVSQKGNASLKLTLGLPPVGNFTVGAKTDDYLPLGGEPLRVPIAALAPDLIGRSVTGAQLRGRRCLVEVVTEQQAGYPPRPRVAREKNDAGVWVGRYRPATATFVKDAPDDDIPFCF